MPVVDASPLIYLGKINKLHVLKKLYGRVKCPPGVYREVVIKGREKGFADAAVIEKAVGDYVIIQHPEEETLDKLAQQAVARGYHLGRGEIEGIALCYGTGEKIYLCDDDDAKELAKAYGIAGKGTIYLLLKAYKTGILSKKETRVSFAEIVEKGFWISPKIVDIFYKRMEYIAGILDTRE